MANQSLLKLLMSGKARVVGVVVGSALVVGASGYWFYHHRKASALQAGASISAGSDLQALPGVGNPSQEYIKSVQYTNKKNADTAAKKGESNVPTLTKGSFIGNPEDFLNSTGDMTSHSCKKPHKDPQACSVTALKAARKSGVTADELKCKGCQCPALKSVGFTAGDLKKAGFDAKGLKECGFTAKQLKDAGFTAKELRDAGFSAKQLKDAGFTAKQLKDAGFSAKDLKKAGYSDADIANAGYSPAELAAAGVKAPKQDKDCNPTAIKRAHDTGVSAQLMRQKGCGLTALKAAGYGADDLRNAGFTAKQLNDAGLLPSDLKAAGFSASDLKNAGLSAGQLKDAGMNAKDLTTAGYSPEDLHDAGYDADQLRKAGLTSDQLKRAGFTAGDLIRAGYTPEQAGYVSEHHQDLGPAINNGMDQVQQGSMMGVSSQGIPNVAADTMEGRLAKIQKIQEEQLAAREQRQALNQEEANMAQQAQQFQKQWGNVAVQQYMQQKAPKSVASEGAGSSATAAGNGQQAGINGPVLKAGTVMFAILDTGVNTDNTGSPVMARIVTGPLKGTKLMGQFTRVDQQVQLRFNLASIPGMPSSMSINAVAIDQNTAQTAVSGKVNNHYLLRYGSLFASAFISGMSDAIQSGGNTLVGPGIIWHSHDRLNTAQQVAVGLGNVGQQYAQNMSDNFNRAPTIKIPGGTGLGVLLMGDMQLPSDVKLNPGVVKASQQG